MPFPSLSWLLKAIGNTFGKKLHPNRRLREGSGFVLRNRPPALVYFLEHLEDRIALSAAATFDFESVTSGTTSFSSSGVTWSLTGDMRNEYFPGNGSPLPGNASPTTAGFVDTGLKLARPLGNVGGIQVANNYVFHAVSFDVWPSSDEGGKIYGGSSNTLGTVGLNYEVIGKLGGNKVVTADVTDTVRSPAQTGTAFGGYYHHIDLSGTAFATTNIDTVEFVLVAQTGVAMDYLGVDNFEYSSLVSTAPPTLNLSQTSLSLGTTTSGTASTPAQSFTVDGTALSNNVVITAPTGVQLSIDSGATWQTSETLTPTTGTLATTTIQARISASASVGSITGNITNVSTGATEKDISVSGTVNALPALSVSTTSLSLGTTTTGTASSPVQTYTISGTSLTNNVSITAPTGVELSKDSGTTWQTSETLTPSNGTLATTTIQVRISASAGAGNITGNITNVSTGATERDVSVSGTVNAILGLSVSKTSLSLGTTTTGTASSPVQTYTVSGSALTNNVVITAPTGVELSKDSGATWQTSETLIPSSGTLATTTVQVRISASASVGSITGNITNVSTGATERDISVTGTVNAKPVLNVSTNLLSLGTTTAGTASIPVQSFTVSGTALTNRVIITAPTGVELSKDSGATWQTSETFLTSGTLATTTIQARISATASAGSITGNITNSSSGASGQNISVTGTVIAAPGLTVSTTSLSLGTTTTGTASSPVKTYTVSGTVLSNNVVITAPTGVELSKDSGATWQTSETLMQTSGTLATTTIEARISASASVGSITGNITNVSTGTTEKDISVTGTVNAKPVLNVSTNSLSLGTTTAGTASTPVQSFTVGGTALTNNVVITAPTGVELSKDSGATWQTSETLTPTSGTLATTTIEARIRATASAGSITGNITNTSTGASGKNISVTGTVNALPTISVSKTTLNLGTTTTGTASSPAQTYTISGTSLTNNVVITAPAGVELSKDSGATWQTSETLTPTSGTLATTLIQVRISASASTGSITGNITNVSTGATEKDTSVSGTVNVLPALLVSTTSLNLGATTTGTASIPPQSYTVGGRNLTNNVVISAPTGVELSKDSGATWQTSETLIPTSGTLSTTTIQVRISASAIAGSFTSKVTNISAGATEQDVSVSGSVNALTGISVSTALITLGTTTTGTASVPARVQAFTVGGTALTSDVVITAPTGVELSQDGGATWQASETLTPTSGILATTTIQARISASASAGSITGNITNVSIGTTERDISVSGTVNALPALSVSTTSLNLGTTTTGTASTSVQSYTVSGTDLTDNLVITAPTGVELSQDSGATWQTSETLIPTSGTLYTTTIQVRISASASVGNIIDNITNVSAGATEQDISVSGTVNALPVLSVSTTSLNLGTTTTGTASTSVQSYTISGTNLTDNLVVTAPTGVELSIDRGATWQTSETLIPSSGTLATTTIQVRISASASVGSITGNITNVSTGATEQDISVSGTVNPAVATVTQTTVSWGTSGTSGALVTQTDGLRLLPAGRNTDFSWLGINRITITLSAAETLSPSDVSVTGVTVANYGPVTLSGGGTTYTITLAQPINQGDRVTVSLGNSGITTFTRRLDVLPGDVNDDGVVNSTDGVITRAGYLGQTVTVPLAFLDIDGNGLLDSNDFTLVRARSGKHLP